MSNFRQDFLAFAERSGALQFGDFKTRAGRQSPYFFNTGRFADGAALRQLGIHFADALIASKLPFDGLYGPAYKGIPLVSSVSIALAEKGRNVPYSFNRKEAKDHGEGGLIVGSALKGRIVVVDDVMTDGASKRESVDIIKAHGAEVAAVLITLDRMERGTGARSAIAEFTAQYGVPVISIATLDDLLVYLEGKPQHAASLAATLRYREQYGA